MQPREIFLIMQQFSLLWLSSCIWFTYYSKGDISAFFFNALKINCFIVIERKYPNSCYNNFSIPLAVDNISFYQGINRTLLVVADLLFKRPICDKRSAPFAVNCPTRDPKKIDKKDGVLLTALNFREKIVSPAKRKHIAEVSNFSVTSCLLEALKIELTTPPPPFPPTHTHSERNAWEKT